MTTSLSLYDFMKQFSIGSLFTNTYDWEHGDKYPPYSIQTYRGSEKAVKTQIGSYTTQGDITGYKLEIACAGFTKNDLHISVFDNKELRIEATKLNKNQEEDTQHGGFSKRGWRRTFALGNNIKVKSAKLENGLLSIILDVVEKKAVTQEIVIE